MQTQPVYLVTDCIKLIQKVVDDPTSPAAHKLTGLVLVGASRLGGHAVPSFPKATWKKLISNSKVVKQLAAVCAARAQTQPGPKEDSCATYAAFSLLYVLLAKARHDGVLAHPSRLPAPVRSMRTERKMLSTALSAVLQQQLRRSGLQQHMPALLDAAAQAVALTWGVHRSAVRPAAAVQEAPGTAGNPPAAPVPTAARTSGAVTPVGPGTTTSFPSQTPAALAAAVQDSNAESPYDITLPHAAQTLDLWSTITSAHQDLTPQQLAAAACSSAAPMTRLALQVMQAFAKLPVPSKPGSGSAGTGMCRQARVTEEHLYALASVNTAVDQLMSAAMTPAAMQHPQAVPGLQQLLLSPHFLPCLVSVAAINTFCCQWGQGNSSTAPSTASSSSSKTEAKSSRRSKATKGASGSTTSAAAAAAAPGASSSSSSSLPTNCTYSGVCHQRLFELLQLDGNAAVWSSPILQRAPCGYHPSSLWSLFGGIAGHGLCWVEHATAEDWQHRAAQHEQDIQLLLLLPALLMSCCAAMHAASEHYIPSCLAVAYNSLQLLSARQDLLQKHPITDPSPAALPWIQRQYPSMYVDQLVPQVVQVLTSLLSKEQLQRPPVKPLVESLDMGLGEGKVTKPFDINAMEGAAALTKLLCHLLCQPGSDADSDTDSTSVSRSKHGRPLKVPGPTTSSSPGSGVGSSSGSQPHICSSSGSSTGTTTDKAGLATGCVDSAGRFGSGTIVTVCTGAANSNSSSQWLSLSDACPTSNRQAGSLQGDQQSSQYALSEGVAQVMPSVMGCLDNFVRAAGRQGSFGNGNGPEALQRAVDCVLSRAVYKAAAHAAAGSREHEQFASLLVSILKAAWAAPTLELQEHMSSLAQSALKCWLDSWQSQLVPAGHHAGGSQDCHVATTNASTLAASNSSNNPCGSPVVAPVESTAAAGASSSSSSCCYTMGFEPFLAVFGRCCLSWASMLHQNSEALAAAASAGLGQQYGAVLACVRGMLPNLSDMPPSVLEGLGTPPVVRELQQVFIEGMWLLGPSAAAFPVYIKQVLEQLGASGLSAELVAAGYDVQDLQDKAQQALAAQQAAAMKTNATSLAALATALQQFGLACSDVAVPCFCNYPACSNLAGPTELQLVSGRSCMCAGCLTARYCSRECQKQHWKRHKTVCKHLTAAAAATPAKA